MSYSTCSGPLFDGQAERAAARGTDAIRRKVAEEGERLAASALMAAIRHHGTGRAVRAVTIADHSRVYQTGKYTMPVVVDRNEEIVTTDLASYGPWLAGTGSRNLTTRFKGYNYQRLAGQTLDGIAEGLAEDTIQPYIREMN